MSDGKYLICYTGFIFGILIAFTFIDKAIEILPAIVIGGSLGIFLFLIIDDAERYPRLKYSLIIGLLAFSICYFLGHFWFHQIVISISIGFIGSLIGMYLGYLLTSDKLAPENIPLQSLK